MKAALVTLGILFAIPAGATEVLSVDTSSLPKGWYLRDASEFAKLGITAKTLVFAPVKDATPKATVQIVGRRLKEKLGPDAAEWTKHIVQSKPSTFTFRASPSLSTRGNLRVWRAEMFADSDVGLPHYFVVEALEKDGALLIFFSDNTQGAHQGAVAAVRDLFDHVSASVAIQAERSAINLK